MRFLVLLTPVLTHFREESLLEESLDLQQSGGSENRGISICITNSFGAIPIEDQLSDTSFSLSSIVKKITVIIQVHLNPSEVNMLMHS